MGLDMYLEYRRNIGKLTPEQQRQMFIAELKRQITYSSDDIIHAIADEMITKNTPYAEVVMYWRKANAIHRFFVNHCANGVDECQDIPVTINDLRTLTKQCKKVLDTIGADLVKDEGSGLWTVPKGHKIDEGVAHKELPTQEGFFFGDTSYDDYYAHTLKATIDALALIIENPDQYTDPIVYSASW